MDLEGTMFPVPRTTSICFPQAPAPVVVVVVIVLAFIVILTVLGYTPVLSLSLVMAALTVAREAHASPAQST